MNLSNLCKLFSKFANPQIEILKDESLPETSVEEARKVLYYYLKKMYHDDPLILKRLGDRYSYKLLNHESSKYEDKFSFLVNIKANQHAFPGKPNMFDEIKTVEFKTPQAAMDSIETNPNYVYRGMCFEEFESIKQSGFIQSNGSYNLGNAQKNHTFFGEDFGTAKMYAGSFAPFQFKPTHNKPGVVIAIDKDLTLSYKDNPEGIPEGERAITNKLPASFIKEIYFIIPSEKFLNFRITLTKRKHPSAPLKEDYWKFDYDQRSDNGGCYVVLDVTNRFNLKTS